MKGEQQMRIGFLGLGAMGSGMVARLAEKGFEVSVYNRTTAKAAALAEFGVRVAADPADAARGAEIVLVSLATAEISASMLLGPGGALDAAAPTAVIADMSTVSPEAARAQAAEVSRTGRQPLDACVLGNAQHARDGELRFMIGGAAEAVEKIRPVLDVLAKQVVQLGAAGMGATAKVAMNLLMGVQLQALSEAVIFGERAGLSREQLMSMIAVSGYSSPMMRFKTGVMASRSFEQADFKLALMRKDLMLALADAQRLGVPMPVTSASYEVLTAAVNAGLGELDCAAVLTEVERQAGVTSPAPIKLNLPPGGPPGRPSGGPTAGVGGHRPTQRH